jgi:SAM-dependent methyltransferase
MQSFDYEHRTRRRYQDDAWARRYHAKFTGGSAYRGSRVKRWRSRFVADRERATLRGMLVPYRPRVVVDVPCGTGKMAPVFADLGATVVSVDISPQMIAIARDVYRTIGFDDVEFVTSDVESLASVLDGRPVDVACCVRLMHRVPHDVRKRILEQLALSAPRTVVSYRIDSRSERLLTRVLRNKGTTFDPTTRRQAEAEIGEWFTVVDAKPIARGLCSEWFFLAEPRLARS